MAAGKSNAALFYSILNGKVVRQFQTPTENSVSRVNKNGKTVHEEVYDFIDGIITGIDTRESEYGKQWIVSLRDEESGATQVLQFNYSSGYANGFLKALPNVDLKASVKLSPSEKEVDGKKKTTMFINQHGKSTKWFYTKENPNGLPQLKKIKIKGKETWDDSDSLAFLEAMAKSMITARTMAPVQEVEQEEAPF